MIQARITQLSENIARICQKLGRDPNAITLVGVTKYASAAMIKEAIAGGITHLGENKVQESIQKYPALKNAQLKFTAHMIGHLQTNKVKQALQIFDCIQSVDSVRLAEELDRHAAVLKRFVPILIQVNVSGEQQKFGFSKDEALPAVKAILGLGHIQTVGFMTMAPLTEDKDWIRSCFRTLRELRDQVQDRFGGSGRAEMKYLSMGMSSDYEIALEEGSNMLRIGSTIFRGET